MKTNNLIFGAIGVLVLGVIVWFYFNLKKKTITALTNTSANNTTTPTNTGTGTTTTPTVIKPPTLDYLVSTLTEADKAQVHILAKEMHDDISGLNYHNMTIYERLSRLSDAKLVYFVTVAWNIYDRSSVVNALKGQKWNKLTSASKKAGWTEQKAIASVTGIIQRVTDFKYS